MPSNGYWSTTMANDDRDLKKSNFLKGLNSGSKSGSKSMFGDFPFILNDYYDQALIEKLITQGIVTEDDKVIAARMSRDLPDYPSRAIWLEQKDFEHLLARHTNRFNIFGISLDPQTIGNLIFQAFTKYPIVRTEPGRVSGTVVYVYEIRRPGGSGYIHAVVDRDGHIVTAYTTKRLSSSTY